MLPTSLPGGGQRLAGDARVFPLGRRCGAPSPGWKSDRSSSAQHCCSISVWQGVRA